MQLQWLTLRKFKSKSSDVRFEAVQEMLESGDPRYVDPLMEALHDEWAVIRVVAAEALGKIGDERAIEALVPSLQDEDRSVRSSAVRALGTLGWKPNELEDTQPAAAEPGLQNTKSDRSRIPSLIASLGHPANGTKAGSALARVGEPAVGPLLDVLRGDDPWARHNAIAALGEIGDRNALKRLIGLLNDGNPETAQAIAAIGGEEAVGALIEALDNPRSDVCAAASKALGASGDRKAVGPLIDAARKRNKDFDSIASALGELRDVSAAPYLITNIKRKSAAIALRDLGSRCVPLLIEKLDSPDYEVRRASAEVLGQIGDPRAIGPLSQRINHGRHCLRALEMLDWEPAGIEERMLQNLAHGRLEEVLAEGPSAFGPMIDAFDNEDPYMRNAASAVMARFGSPALKKLTEALKDERLRVRTRAASTLAAIGDEKAVTPLIAALKADLSLESVEALGKLGGSKAVEALLSILKDQDAVTYDRSDSRKGKKRPAHLERAAAAEALGPSVEQEKVLDALTEALDDDNPLVRDAALEAAGDALDKRAADPLLAMLSVERAFVVDPASVQLRISRSVRLAIEALTRLSDPRAAAAFVRIIQSPAFSSVLETAVGELTYLIERAGPSLAEEDLQTALELPDTQSYSFDEIENGRAVKRVVTADCTRVKWLANEELSRRQPVAEQAIGTIPDSTADVQVESASPDVRDARHLVMEAQQFVKPLESVISTPSELSRKPPAAGKRPEIRQDILIRCGCGAEAYVSSQFAGKRGKCKVCGEPVTVPEIDDLEAAIA